jgi:hypothetical protein
VVLEELAEGEEPRKRDEGRRGESGEWMSRGVAIEEGIRVGERAA